MSLRLLAFIFTVFIFTMATGCSKVDAPAKDNVIAPQGKTLLIGLIPEQNIFRQIERYEPLAGYLGRKIGVNIQLKVLPLYGNVIDNFNFAGMDGAFLGSFTYALAHMKLGLEVLARPEDDRGVSTYRGIVLVRKDSGIRTVRQMRGNRFAFVDRATSAGYLFPLVYLKRAGVIRPESFFREMYFTGTHEDAIYDVLNRKADIGASKDTVLDRIAAGDPRLREELLVLGRSPAFPENALVVRHGVDESVRVKIRDVLLAMDRDPEGRKILDQFGTHKFIATDDGDYEVVRQYARSVGIDLSTYDPTNN